MRPCQSQEELGVHPTLLPRCILSIWKAPTLEGEGGGLAEGGQKALCCVYGSRPQHPSL